MSSDEGAEDGGIDDHTSYLFYGGERLKITLQWIKENDPQATWLRAHGNSNFIQDMNEEWEEIGRDVSNNTHLTEVAISHYALNDYKMSMFFRGLRRSNSIEVMNLKYNELSSAGVRSMVPFLQNANNLKELILFNNNIQSEGFNVLLRSLQNSPIEELCCSDCGITSIEIRSVPQHLTLLDLSENSISVDGCRVLAKLLQEGDATLSKLYLHQNKIDDEGVEILVDALQNNTSLVELLLSENDGISKEGHRMLLKLVNDISSIKATLRSNHSLRQISLTNKDMNRDINIAIFNEIYLEEEDNPETAGRKKVIQTQLRSGLRATLQDALGVHQSLYSEINPLHLPEVLSLIGREHGQGELYIALKSSIAGVISTVKRKAASGKIGLPCSRSSAAE